MARARTTYDPDSVQHIKDYPKTLRLYKFPASKCWQVYFYVSRTLLKGSKPKAFRKSTETESLSEAKRFAIEFYHDTMRQVREGVPGISRGDFKAIAEDLLKTNTRRQERGERKSVVKDLTDVLKADMAEFFDKYNVQDIDYILMQKYLDSLEEKKYSNQTLKKRISFLHQILVHAQRTKKLVSLPAFPVVSIKDNPRPWLTEKQYHLLLDMIEEAIRQKVKVTYTVIDAQLYYLVQFLANSFARPGDLSLIRHHDIEVCSIPGLSYLKVILRSKVHPQVVITKQAAAEAYERLQPKGFRPEDYVFFPNLSSRKEVQSIMSRQFAKVLRMAGLKKDTEGNDRTLYSLRHSCICHTLRKGQWDIGTIAANARTSVEMISRFYSTHLKAETMVKGLDKGISAKVSVEERIRALSQDGSTVTTVRYYDAARPDEEPEEEGIIDDEHIRPLPTDLEWEASRQKLERAGLRIPPEDATDAHERLKRIMEEDQDEEEDP